MGDMLYPLPNPSFLSGMLEKWFMGAKYVYFATSVPDLTCLRHLGKATKDLQIQHIFDDVRFEGVQVDDDEIHSTNMCTLYTFTYKDTKMAMYTFSYPNVCTYTFVFVPPDQVPLVKDLIVALKAFQKHKKEVYLYGRKWVPVDKLDDRYFITPQLVENKFRREILPQLETKVIHNHTLLYSPPGYGKSAWIRRLCKQYQDWTFIIVAPAVIEKPWQIFSVLEYAQDYQPAVVFFEDIDTLGGTRGIGSERMDPFLGALLNGVDGLETYQNIYVMASTNNPKAIDPALRRAGRFGIHIPFKYTKSEMARIFNQYINDTYSASDLSFPPELGPAQIRSVAKTVLGRVAMEKIPITLELIKDTVKIIEREGDLLDENAFKAMPDSQGTTDKESTPCVPFTAPKGMIS